MRNIFQYNNIVYRKGDENDSLTFHPGWQQTLQCLAKQTQSVCCCFIIMLWLWLWHSNYTSWYVVTPCHDNTLHSPYVVIISYHGHNNIWQVISLVHSNIWKTILLGCSRAIGGVNRIEAFSSTVSTNCFSKCKPVQVGSENVENLNHQL